MTIDNIAETAGKNGAVAATCVGAAIATAYCIETVLDTSITPFAIGLTALGAGGLQQLRRYIREEYIPISESCSSFQKKVAAGFLGVTAVSAIAGLSVVDALISPFYSNAGRSVHDIISYAGLLAGSYAVVETSLTLGKKWLALSPVPKVSLAGVLAIAIGLGYISSSSGKNADEMYVDDEQEEATEEYIEGRGFDEINSPFTIEMWPVDNPNHIVSSCFGFRGYHVAGGNGTVIHEGIDIRAKKGTSVFSVSSGTVTDVDQYRWGAVSIDTGDGHQINYLHLNTTAVQRGDVVEEGQIIGTVGNREPRGIDDYRPHLHLEIVDANLPDTLVDPNGNNAVLRHRANPLCYMDPALSYSMVPSRGCVSQGGWAKFCEAYHLVSADTSTRNKKLDQIQLTYSPIVEPAVRETHISPSLVYALIMRESRGNASAFSPDKQYVGLMQLSKNVALAYGACDEGCTNDERTNPEKAIPAAVAYLEQLQAPFVGYKAQNELMLVAYNAGPAVAQALFAQTGDVPWSEMRCELKETLLAEVYTTTHDSSLQTTRQRQRKSEITQEYVDAIITYEKKYEN
jgi:murein DD-endopeptidase MepM/ murein hydrolase activator NlpD